MPLAQNIQTRNEGIQYVGAPAKDEEKFQGTEQFQCANNHETYSRRGDPGIRDTENVAAQQRRKGRNAGLDKTLRAQAERHIRRQWFPAIGADSFCIHTN